MGIVSPEGLVTRGTESYLQPYRFSKPGIRLIIYASDEFMGDSDATDLGTMLSEPLCLRCGRPVSQTKVATGVKQVMEMMTSA